MNTIQETKSRLRGLALALATILDNYGVNSSQQPEYNVARQELEDIISNIADTPPPAPVTVESVVAGVMAGIEALAAQMDASTNAGVHELGVKIDSLVALANAHGEAQQAASAA
ncbi:hypothetical protein [Herbaspirillum huttiense]|uniref:hypothetical protein n=1 Tax=Herbaspirillum huttiense TaxID=863372 RepID=UPI0031DCD8A0